MPKKTRRRKTYFRERTRRRKYNGGRRRRTRRRRRRRRSRGGVHPIQMRKNRKNRKRPTPGLPVGISLASLSDALPAIPPKARFTTAHLVHAAAGAPAAPPIQRASEGAQPLRSWGAAAAAARPRRHTAKKADRAPRVRHRRRGPHRAYAQKLPPPWEREGITKEEWEARLAAAAADN